MVNARSSRRRMNKMRKTRSNLKKTYRNLSRRSNRHVSRKHQTRRYRGGMESNDGGGGGGGASNATQQDKSRYDFSSMISGVSFGDLHNPKAYLDALRDTPTFMGILKRDYDKALGKRLSWKIIEETNVPIQSYKRYTHQDVAHRIKLFDETYGQTTWGSVKKSFSSVTGYEQKSVTERLKHVFQEVTDFDDFGKWKLVRIEGLSSVQHYDVASNYARSMFFKPSIHQDYRIMLHMVPIKGYAYGESCGVAAYLFKKSQMIFDTATNTLSIFEKCVSSATTEKATGTTATATGNDASANTARQRENFVSIETDEIMKNAAQCADALGIEKNENVRLFMRQRGQHLVGTKSMKKLATDLSKHVTKCVCPVLHYIPQGFLLGAGTGMGLVRVVGTLTTAGFMLIGACTAVGLPALAVAGYGAVEYLLSGMYKGFKSTVGSAFRAHHTRVTIRCLANLIENEKFGLKNEGKSNKQIREAIQEELDKTGFQVEMPTMEDFNFRGRSTSMMASPSHEETPSVL